MKIFVAGSGRCGTGYLHKGFAAFTNFNAYHEQEPVLAGPLLWRANSYKNVKACKEKARAISRLPGNYIDTAHQFMRGFARYALAEMPDLKVVKLARDPLEVCVSRLNRGVVPGTKKGNHWLGKPNSANSLLKLKKQDWAKLSDFQKILLDWLEHEYRFVMMREQFEQVVYVRFEDLVQRPRRTFKELFTELGIADYDHKFAGIGQLARNGNKKATVVQPHHFAESYVLVEMLTSYGYDLTWLEEHYYQSVIKRRHFAPEEWGLLEHYDSHPEYASVDPEYALDRLGYRFPKNRLMLDLGCGDGRWMQAIKQRYGAWVHGVDFSEERINLGRKKYPGLHLFHDNAYDYVMNYDGWYDSVLMVEVLEHLEDPALLIKELARITDTIVGTTPLNFPYKAHLQVWESIADLAAVFEGWELEATVDKFAANDTNPRTIYFIAKRKEADGPGSSEDAIILSADPGKMLLPATSSPKADP